MRSVGDSNISLNTLIEILVLVFIEYNYFPEVKFVFENLVLLLDC